MSPASTRARAAFPGGLRLPASLGEARQCRRQAETVAGPMARSRQRRGAGRQAGRLSACSAEQCLPLPSSARSRGLQGSRELLTQQLEPLIKTIMIKEKCGLQGNQYGNKPPPPAGIGLLRALVPGGFTKPIPRCSDARRGMRNSPWGEAGSSPTHVVGGQGGDNKHHSEDFVTDARALPIAFLSISEGRGEVLPVTPRLLLEPHNLGENGDSSSQAGMRRRRDGGPGCWVPAPTGRGEPGHAREGTPIPGCSGSCCIPAGWLSCPGGARYQ